MNDNKEKELKRIADELEKIRKYLRDIAAKITNNNSPYY